MAGDYSTRTPGQMLRAAREEKGFSLAVAAEGTKIPLRLIEAIERDEYHKLSGPLYVKSFLRNYASWVGLNEGEILNLYEVATGRPEQTPSAEDQVWTEDQVAVTRVGVPWTRLVIIGVAAAVVLVVLVIVAIRIFSGGGGEAATTAAETTTIVKATQEEGEAVAIDTLARQAQERQAAQKNLAAQQTNAAQQTDADRQSRPRVRSEIQPDERQETAEERLARLDEHTFGLPDSPAADGTPATAPPEVAVQQTEPVADLSPPRRGDSDLRFTGGETYPLVLRVVIPAPANCTVRRDDDAAAVPVVWPDSPGPPPAYNVRHGVAYAVEGGYAIYWGAGDHFTLTLDRVQGVDVTLNGTPLSLRNWRPGQTKLLDRSSLPSGG